MGITNRNGKRMRIKTRLNLGLGMGMGINHWEWEGMGLKKIFPLIFNRKIETNRKSDLHCDLYQTDEDNRRRWRHRTNLAASTATMTASQADKTDREGTIEIIRRQMTE